MNNSALKIHTAYKDTFNMEILMDIIDAILWVLIYGGITLFTFLFAIEIQIQIEHSFSNDISVNFDERKVPITN